MLTSTEVIPSLGKQNNAQVQALLDRLDMLDEQSVDKKRRKSPRYRYRQPDLFVRITQPGGGIHECRVQSRNLSATGLWFLYPGFLYIGTLISLRLRKHLGSSEMMNGTVAWCKHIAGTNHSVGVKFDMRIFPRLYVNPSDLGDTEETDRVDPSTLAGNVLMIDSQMMDRLLFEHQLTVTRIKPVCVPTCEEAIKELKGTTFDLIVSDLNLTDCRGEDAFKQIRTAGYRGPFVALTAESSPARLQAAHAAGATATVNKPYEVDRLMSVLAAFLKDGGITADQWIYSSMAKQPKFEPILRQFVDNVRGMALSIKQAINEDKLDVVRNYCLTLKGSGGGFGFPILSDAAKEACKILDATMSVAESTTQLDPLLQICRRITADAPPP